MPVQDRIGAQRSPRSRAAQTTGFCTCSTLLSRRELRTSIRARSRRLSSYRAAPRPDRTRGRSPPPARNRPPPRSWRLVTSWSASGAPRRRASVIGPLPHCLRNGRSCAGTLTMASSGVRSITSITSGAQPSNAASMSVLSAAPVTRLGDGHVLRSPPVGPPAAYVDQARTAVPSPSNGRHIREPRADARKRLWQARIHTRTRWAPAHPRSSTGRPIGCRLHRSIPRPRTSRPSTHVARTPCIVDLKVDDLGAVVDGCVSGSIAAARGSARFGEYS